MKTYIFLLTCLLFYTSCVINPNPIDVLIEEPEPSLVISSINTINPITTIGFSKSFSALVDTAKIKDQNFLDKILVDSANVSISYNNKTVNLPKILPGIYSTLGVEFLENTKYTLVAYDYKTKKELRASTFIKPEVKGVQISTFFEGGDSTDLYGFNCVFSDSAGEENFYLATYTSLSSTISTDTLPSFLKNFLKSASPSFDIFSDRITGDGKSITYSPLLLNAMEGDSFRISVAEITKEHFNYLSAYRKAGNIFSSLVSEPTKKFPSNVENGLGFFSMLQPRYFNVVVKK